MSPRGGPSWAGVSARAGAPTKADRSYSAAPERRARPRARIMSIVLVAGVLAGCPGAGAGEVLETARFEELQGNAGHARQLYRSILMRWPDRPEAVTARERLVVLDGVRP